MYNKLINANEVTQHKRENENDEMYICMNKCVCMKGKEK